MADRDTPTRPGISRARLAHIAAWSIDLPSDESDRAASGIVEKTYARGTCICPKNTLLESWTGVVTGLIKVGTASPEGRAITFTGVPLISGLGDVCGFVHTSLTAAPTAQFLNPSCGNTNGLDYAKNVPSTIVRVGSYAPSGSAFVGIPPRSRTGADDEPSGSDGRLRYWMI